jgi:hypothetical protein
MSEVKEIEEGEVLGNLKAQELLPEPLLNVKIENSEHESAGKSKEYNKIKKKLHTQRKTIVNHNLISKNWKSFIVFLCFFFNYFQ